jgi:ribosomal protein L22
MAKPGDPQKGKAAEEEQVEAAAEEAKDVAAETAADETEAKPKRAPRKKTTAKKTAAKKTTAKKAEPAEEKPAAEPKAKKEAAPPSGELVTVRAQARYVRTSARKARLVCEHLRGKSVPEARALLAHTTRAAARDWSKVLESAIANAEHNHELDGDALGIQSAYADEGPTLKRFRPRAMGRATRIRKRTAHLTITLSPKE